MRTAIYMDKYLNLELDKFGVKLNKTEHEPKVYKTKVEVAINIPFRFRENKNYIKNIAKVYGKQISKKISEVKYMEIEENSIEDSDDISIKVLMLG